MGRMPDRENLTIVNAFYGDENCFAWIQLSGEKMKISFKFRRSDLPGKCILWIQKKEGYTLLESTVSVMPNVYSRKL